jgi:hypothetical protein
LASVCPKVPPYPCAFAVAFVRHSLSLPWLPSFTAFYLFCNYEPVWGAHCAALGPSDFYYQVHCVARAVVRRRACTDCLAGVGLQLSWKRTYLFLRYKDRPLLPMRAPITAPGMRCHGLVPLPAVCRHRCNEPLGVLGAEFASEFLYLQWFRANMVLTDFVPAVQDVQRVPLGDLTAASFIRCVLTIACSLWCMHCAVGLRLSLTRPLCGVAVCTTSLGIPSC